jgi:hypothetical protein
MNLNEKYEKENIDFDIKSQDVLLRVRKVCSRKWVIFVRAFRYNSFQVLIQVIHWGLVIEPGPITRLPGATKGHLLQPY